MAYRLLCGLLMFGAILASGCSLNWSVNPDVKQIPIKHDSPVHSRTEKFGELITAPGQRVPINPTPMPLPDSIPQEAPKPIQPVKPDAVEVPLQSDPDDRVKAPEQFFQSLLPHQQPDSPFLAACRAYQDGRREFAGDQLRWFSPMNQAILAKLLPAAARTAAGPIGDPKDATDILNQIESAAEIVRPFSELKIESLRICDRVIDFGEFVPSKSHYSDKHVILYYEIENLLSEQVSQANGESSFRYAFLAKLKIRGNGKSTETIAKPFKRQSSRPVRDLFAGMALIMPSQPGAYTLELEIIDVHGRKASKSLDFRVDERR